MNAMQKKLNNSTDFWFIKKEKAASQIETAFSFIVKTDFRLSLNNFLCEYHFIVLHYLYKVSAGFKVFTKLK